MQRLRLRTQSKRREESLELNKALIAPAFVFSTRSFAGSKAVVMFDAYTRCLWEMVTFLCIEVTEFQFKPNICLFNPFRGLLGRST